ncbi:GNAT family N-acetyltransferase [Reinekea blandensis]|uniref:Acetyltransferase n=1 Tax=Reinekea blandensis MED297 TaxID=314283 RepID=A4BGZ8_9GAMM|nr:GNAT family protein [Reinekea blandensis]EAR08644.1 acetyltransferase [Reinekea sp. MED297] [Reinekea blandensis MED297]
MNIETSRLWLRDFSESDADAYCRLTRDAVYQRFYSEEDCSDDKSRRLAALFAAQAQDLDRQKFQLAIVLKETGEFIGTAGLRVEPDSQASVGCGVEVRYQGAGFAEEAMSALLDIGFSMFNLHRVYAETIAENRAAIQLCERLGFRQEGLFVENRWFKDRWWSTAILAILKSEWDQRKAD